MTHMHTVSPVGLVFVVCIWFVWCECIHTCTCMDMCILELYLLPGFTPLFLVRIACLVGGVVEIVSACG